LWAQVVCAGSPANSVECFESALAGLTLRRVVVVQLKGNPWAIEVHGNTGSNAINIPFIFTVSSLEQAITE